MKKFYLLILTSILVVGFTSHQVQALTLPDLTISDVKTSSRDNTAVQLQFTVSNYSSQKEISVDYKRKGQSSYSNQFMNQGVYQNGTYYVTLYGLVPNVRYYYKVKLEANDSITTSKYTFVTRSHQHTKVTDIQPRTVSVGDTITITGQGFGNRTGQLNVGYGYEDYATIQSWTDSKIVATVDNTPTDGPVTVQAYTFQTNKSGYYPVTVTSDIQLDVLNESHAYYIACMPGVIADTYEAATNFDDLYKQEFGRSIQCDELEFHLQHSTPHDKLQTWLNAQTAGIWWDNLTSKYDGQVIYNATDMFYVTGGKLYHIPDLMTALAYGFNLDDATMVSDLTVTDDRQYALSEAPDLNIWDGIYFRKVLNLADGKTVTFPDSIFQTYANKEQPLIAENANTSSDDVCQLVECGEVY